MIRVEGYLAFHGTMMIVPKGDDRGFYVTADWLYKPDTRCWYGNGSSYPDSICTIISEGD